MYSELHCKTNFSFLTGASHADELVERAIELGYHSLAITDENTLAGVVRAYSAARAHQTDSPATAHDFKLIIGAEIILNDSLPVLLWATDRASYGRLSRLITVGRRRAPKGECWLSFDDLANHHEGLLAGVLPYLPGQPSRIDHIDIDHTSYPWFQKSPWLESNPTSSFAAASTPATVTQSTHQSLHRFRELFGDRAYLMAALYHGVDDAWRLQQLQQMSQQTSLPLVASGDVLYHRPARLPLHDVLTATKHHTNVATAGDLLLPNASRHLKPVSEHQTSFAAAPAALARTREIADRCNFCLSHLRYEYPEELAPAGKTPIEHLRDLTYVGVKNRYPTGLPAKVDQQIKHELKLIDELRYEAYFLTVWDLVRFARSQGILCQGRGSAANSAVCYCLGVTSVDPATTDLLFERFISKERDEAPDIDVDFEHERREEVLQYLYQKYGRHRAGLAATVVTYRLRSAVRDVGKALGLSLDRIDALAKHVEGYSSEPDLAGKMRDVGIDPDSDIGQQLIFLINDLLGFPRHLSQHVGGMVITQGALDELVPVENASMDDRTIIQWDKNDLEELGLLKVDCLCLGMLSAIRRCFDLVQQHWGRNCTLANLPQEDPLVYDMICDADTVGVFQIESRGQMSMLPRLKPRCWYDLVIEVAIVRPGPIQGNMVHPFLRRRNGEELAVYPNEAIKQVLHRTLGVPIFQEQAMKLAVVAAGFTPGQADQLRRAMGKWRKTGVIEKFREQLYAGMKERGLNEEFAGQVFRQISGFGEYGFPESHAASFAKLVYVSCWLKRYYPAAFCAALINSQPMGFYQPAQLVADAKAHGVHVLPVDVNHSDWDCTIEPADDGPETDSTFVAESTDLTATKSASMINSSVAQTAQHSPLVPNSAAAKSQSLRLGLRMISGLRRDVAETIIAARRTSPFQSVSEFTRRTNLGQAVLAQLSRADAFGSLNQSRREALWQSLAQEKKPKDQPLFANIQLDDDQTNGLPQLSPADQVTEDYRTVGLSLRAHPLSFHRESLDELNVTTCHGLTNVPNNRWVNVAGLVILRQRPSTAKGITFVTIEDETGSANLIVKRHIWQRYYKIARQSQAWLAYGKLETKSNVTHVIVTRIVDMSEQLEQLKVKPRDFR
jgi:error-prone DNA polymerase